MLLSQLAHAVPVSSAPNVMSPPKIEHAAAVMQAYNKSIRAVEASLVALDSAAADGAQLEKDGGRLEAKTFSYWPTVQFQTKLASDTERKYNPNSLVHLGSKLSAVQPKAGGPKAYDAASLFVETD